MKLTYIKNYEYNAARILGTLTDLKKGFFQKHNFLVLPFPDKNSVYLPDINYDRLLIKNYKSTYHPSDYTSADLQSIEEFLNKNPTPKSLDYNLIESKFESLNKQFLNRLTYIFPDIIKKIHSVYIVVTHYGTTGSFDYKMVGKKYRLYIWVRDTGVNVDVVIANIMHCIVSAIVLLITKKDDTVDHDWRVRESTIDFILEHTSLSECLPHNCLTVKNLESTQKSSELIKKSSTYIKKYFSVIRPPSTTKKMDKYYIGKTIIDDLTFTESRLFDLLHKHTNKFVSKDLIYETLYNGSYDKSDWAISKMMQRLRRKIVQSGVRQNIIMTSRKKGYCLISD